MAKPIGRPRIGIYEKALPDLPDWSSRMAAVAEAGFDFFEIPVDESEQRLRRLHWSSAERAELRHAAAVADVQIYTLILSAHRKFPLGSADPDTRRKALDLFQQSIDLAVDIGARVIQLAGYYVYYEEHVQGSRERFIEGLQQGLTWASSAGVMLGLETMDGEDIVSINDAMQVVKEINSPWLQIYPDMGNLAANHLDVAAELQAGRGHLIGIHLKDSRPNEFRRVPFGDGVVPFVEAFRSLAEIDYQGNFLIEMWNDDAPDAMSRIVSAREWILARLDEANYSPQLVGYQ